MIDPCGEIVATHRKMNLRDDIFEPGTVPVTIVDIKGVKTGLVICYDVLMCSTQSLCEY